DLADVMQQEHADDAFKPDRILGIARQGHRENRKLPAMFRGVLEASEFQRTRLALHSLQLVEFANEINRGLQRFFPRHSYGSSQTEEDTRERSLRGETFELVGVRNRHAGALDYNPLVATKLIQQPRHGFTRSAGHVGDFFMSQRHGETNLGLAG